MHQCLKMLKFVFHSLVLPCALSSEPPFRRVCYFTNWSCDLLEPEAHFCLRHIDPDLCTHFVYAFAQIEVTTFSLTSTRKDDEDTDRVKGRYRLFNDVVRNGTQDVKTLLSIGGLNQSEASFRAVSRTPRLRTMFAQRCAVYLRKWGFDGLDVDWEYPLEQDRNLLSSLLKALRDEFQTETNRTGQTQLLLSVAAPVSKHLVNAGYDVPAIASQVDMINLMAYDFHGAWSDVTGVNSPLYPRQSDARFSQEHSVEWSVQQWLSLGAPPEKINLGIAGYGQSYTLKITNQGQDFFKFITEGQGLSGQIPSHPLDPLIVTLREQERPVSPDRVYLARDRKDPETTTARQGESITLNRFEVDGTNINDLEEAGSIGNIDRSSRSNIRKDMILSIDKPVREINQNIPALNNVNTSIDYRNQRKTFNAELESLDSQSKSPSILNDTPYKNNSSGEEIESNVSLGASIEDGVERTTTPDFRKAARSNLQSLSSDHLRTLPGVETQSKQNRLLPTSLPSKEEASIWSTSESTPENRDQTSSLNKAITLKGLVHFPTVIKIRADNDNIHTTDNRRGVRTWPENRVQTSTPSEGREDDDDGQPTDGRRGVRTWPGQSQMEQPFYVPGIGARSCGPGQPGRLRHLSGQLSYPEICELIGRGGQEFWDEEQQVPYVISGNQWVGYDNARSVGEKVRWALRHQLGGVMFWSLDLDDFKGEYCGQGRYPLLSAINNTLNSLLQDPNSDFSLANSGFFSPNSGFSVLNSGISMPNSGFSKTNSGFSTPNFGSATANSGLSTPSSGSSLANSGFSNPNTGFSTPNSGFSRPYTGPSSANSEHSVHAYSGTFDNEIGKNNKNLEPKDVDEAITNDSTTLEVKTKVKVEDNNLFTVSSESESSSSKNVDTDSSDHLYSDTMLDGDFDPGDDFYYYNDEFAKDVVNDYFYYIAFKRDLPNDSSSKSSKTLTPNKTTKAPTRNETESSHITETPLLPGQNPRTGGNYVALNTGFRFHHFTEQSLATVVIIIFLTIGC